MKLNQPKFTVGDHVSYISTESKPIIILCPDCGGTKVLKATLFDGSEYSIDCDTCEQGGWSGPRGEIQVGYNETPVVEQGLITAVEWDAYDKVFKYRISTSFQGNSGHIVRENRIGRTQDELDAIGEAVKAENLQAVQAQAERKEKPTKSWAWHITYHRRAMRRAQEEYERHALRLGIAQTKLGDEPPKKRKRKNEDQ